MADTKISALTAGAPALSTDELPVARSGANRKLLVSDIATFVNTNIVLSQTVAEVQANNGTYTEGSWIIVSDNIGGLGGSSGTMFEVGPGGYIVGTGWCRTYFSNIMNIQTAVFIDWEPTTDFVSCIKEPLRGNTVTAFYNTAGLTGFPFDSTNIKQTTIIDPVTCSISPLSLIYAATFEGYNTITISRGCTFSGKAGREATVTLSGTTATFTGEVGANGGVTLIGTQALNWYKIFPNVNVDLTDKIRDDYSSTGGFVSQTESTLVFRQSDLDGVSELDMSTNSGDINFAYFPCAGTLAVTSDETQPLISISNFTAGRKYKIISDITSSALDLTVSPFVVGGGNIYLETGFNLVLKGSASPVDYLELQSDLDDVNKLCQVGGANYVI